MEKTVRSGNSRFVNLHAVPVCICTLYGTCNRTFDGMSTKVSQASAPCMISGAASEPLLSASHCFSPVCTLPRALRLSSPCKTVSPQSTASNRPALPQQPSPSSHFIYTGLALGGQSRYRQGAAQRDIWRAWWQQASAWGCAPGALCMRLGAARAAARARAERQRGCVIIAQRAAGVHASARGLAAGLCGRVCRPCSHREGPSTRSIRG